MKHDILQKLQMQLSDLSDINEPRVLYIFAQTRKLIEIEKPRFKHDLLNFYCDWVLHPTMSWVSTKRILEELSKDINSRNSVELIGFEKLRKEFSVFLKHFNLPQFLTSRSDPDQWFDFRKCLIQILVDCPLKRTDTKIQELSLIKTPGFEDWTGERFLNYKFKLDDGTEEIKGIMLGDGGKKRIRRDAENIVWLAKHIEGKLKFRARNKNHKKINT